MTAGSVLILLVAACAAAFVLAPLFRPRSRDEIASSSLTEEQELTSQREMALGALRDVEDDRATGKIDDKDYEDIKARLTARAVEIMKRLDELGAPPSTTR